VNEEDTEKTFKTIAETFNIIRETNDVTSKRIDALKSRIDFNASANVKVAELQDRVDMMEETIKRLQESNNRHEKALQSARDSFEALSSFIDGSKGAHEVTGERLKVLENTLGEIIHVLGGGKK
jgi:uncharacterized protein YlxW (UPF0749 family)